jgi:hypothetical protein
VATPTQLIKDRSRTPFNIGKGVELTGFTLNEAAPLGAGLDPDIKVRTALLERILYWTGGQPCLTQEICAQLAMEPKAGAQQPTVEEVNPRVDAIVARMYFHGNVFKQPHFAYIAEYRVGRFPHKAGILRVLERCRQESGCDPAKVADKVAELKISGLAITAEDGRLRISNRIYKNVFDERWIRAQMPANTWRIVALGSTTSIVLLLAGWFFWLSPMLAERTFKEADIFNAVRAVAFAQSEVPTREKDQLDKYSDEQIARSIRNAINRGAGAGLTEDQYQKLLDYAKTPNISKSLWNDYWLRQTKNLQTLAAKLTTSSGDLSGTKVEIKDTAARVCRGLSQDPQIDSQIHDVSNKAMRSAVKGLWEPVGIGISEKPSEDDAKRLTAVASDITAKWPALAELIGGLVPLADDDVLKDEFTRLVHPLGDQRQAVESADARAQAMLDRVQQSNGEKNRIIRLKSERLRAHDVAIRAMVGGSPRSIVNDLGLIICDALKAVPETSVAALAQLGRELVTLAARVDAKDAPPLAARGAAVLTSAMESASVNDAFSLRQLGDALGVLATHMETKDAVPLAERLANALASVPKTNYTRFATLGNGLALMADQMEPKEGARLAARGAAVLASVLESPPEENEYLWREVGDALAALGGRMDAKDAGPLAERLAKALEHTHENDYRGLAALGKALASLAAQLEAKHAAPLAARGATVLTNALERAPGKDDSPWWDVGYALAALANQLDAKDAVPLAERLAKALENAQDKDNRGLATIGEALVSLATQMDSKHGEPFATRGAAVLVRAVESRPANDDYLLAQLAGTLASLTALMNTRDAGPVAARGAAALTRVLENVPAKGLPFQRLGDALASLGAQMEREDVAPLAERLAKAIENAQEKGVHGLAELGMALASLAARLDAKDAAAMKARGTAVFAKVLESPLGDLSPIGNLDDLVIGLLPWIAQLESGEAASMATLTANRVIESLNLKESVDQALLVSILAIWMDPPYAASIAVRTASVFLHFETAGKSLSPSELISSGLAAASLAVRVPPQESARIEQFAVASLTASRLQDLQGLLKAVRSRLGPKGTVVLVRDWMNALAKLQERQPAQRDKIGQILELLRKEGSAQPSKGVSKPRLAQMHSKVAKLQKAGRTNPWRFPSADRHGTTSQRANV